jgi:hypothetical protein
MLALLIREMRIVQQLTPVPGSRFPVQVSGLRSLVLLPMSWEKESKGSRIQVFVFQELDKHFSILSNP